MRPVAPLTLSVVLAGTVLLSGCGTQHGLSGSERTSGSPSCSPSPTAPGTTGTTGTERDDVTLLGPGCASVSANEFQVANNGTEKLTYTIRFDLLNDSGHVMSNVRQTVAAVGPGQTVKATVEPDTSVPGGGAVSRIRISQVRAVPAGEAPSTAGACPPSGIHLSADEGDAAMGLRVVGLRLTNCGTGPYRLSGHPGLQLLDEKRTPVTGVRILQGTEEISTGLEPGPAPQAMTLQPGESAHSSLAWRNTTGSGDAVNVPYARVTAKPGAPAVTVTPELDLGTTGRLGVGAWRKTTS
ncbi:DUF4232 domain-containing protein [Streptomyces sp. H27-G5]|uniref:DUF4232 domain-containing protein n=1 Tax=Streptomyces sp. H27-G5 TaxID=2996698 RepID=UPI00226D60CE|nr:DUF4232 domain-containing protein [Streptomyces sp. H27-G5]MCY0924347.1 DUF4232 domain-containing protein [Streptomyces sp. H27-G5]